MPDPLADTVSVAEAARLWHFTHQHVNWLCREGKVEHLRPGGPRGHIRIPRAVVYARIGITITTTTPMQVDPNEIRRIIANRTSTR